MIKPFEATDWSSPEDDFSTMFYDQYTSQFWLPNEIPVSSDLNSWKNLTDAQRQVYIYASAGLNALDTLQGEVGMYNLKDLVPGHIRKATLQFQAMMEDIHAKSYSLINKTFLSISEERDVFNWIKSNKELQNKINIIKGEYDSRDISPIGIWKKMVISCMLETALFYSGFFYPLYLAGQGQMTNTGEIFKLIIRDESIHGVYVSMLANELFETFDEEIKEEALDWFLETSHELYINELRYTEAVYDGLGMELVHEVKKFIRFNFNNLTDNLGMERIFEDEEVMPSVKNGLSTSTKTHDFFSQKGTGYQKIEVEPLRDEDFPY